MATFVPVLPCTRVAQVDMRDELTALLLQAAA